MATGVGMIYTGAKAAMSLSGIQYRIDPTSANIPGASANLERGSSLRWRNFDLRMARLSIFGVFRSAPSTETSGTLADSNQRQGKGCNPTFNAELIWGKVKLAKFKLDWFFVKADIETPRDAKGPYLFAPHFARTLVNLNNRPAEPIADHSPMMVDLPYSEPTELQGKVKAP
jgi:hypothetical protein